MTEPIKASLHIDTSQLDAAGNRTAAQATRTEGVVARLEKKLAQAGVDVGRLQAKLARITGQIAKQALRDVASDLVPGGGSENIYARFGANSAQNAIMSGGNPYAFLALQLNALRAEVANLVKSEAERRKAGLDRMKRIEDSQTRFAAQVSERLGRERFERDELFKRVLERMREKEYDLWVASAGDWAIVN